MLLDLLNFLTLFIVFLALLPDYILFRFVMSCLASQYFLVGELSWLLQIAIGDEHFLDDVEIDACQGYRIVCIAQYFLLEFLFKFSIYSAH